MSTGPHRPDEPPRTPAPARPAEPRRPDRPAPPPTRTRPGVAPLAAEHGARLAGVPGVVGVLHLTGPGGPDDQAGGAAGAGRGSGGAGWAGGVELGLYYRAPLDLGRLRSLAAELAGHPVEVARVGGWGAWADGGVRMDVRVGGAPVAVTWLYRDLERVRRERERARLGLVEVHHQSGHPFGFVSSAYVAEVAVGTVAADPSGELARLQRECRDYPEALGTAFVGWLDDARATLAAAEHAATRGDTAYVALCLSRAVLQCAFAIHGRARSWLVDELGAVASAGALPGAPDGFADRATGLLATIGSTPDSLSRACSRVRLLVAEVERTLGR